MAPFPFLSKFGSVDLVVFPQGVRAEAITLSAVSWTGSTVVSVANPVVRLYAEVPVSELGRILLRQSGETAQELLPNLKNLSVTHIGNGAVKGIPARQYRLKIGKKSSVDLWMTSDIPRNDHLHEIGLQILRAISKSAAETVAKLPGTLLYAEINSPSLDKVCILRLKNLTRSSAGFEEELDRGSFYAKAPLVDRLWK